MLECRVVNISLKFICLDNIALKRRGKLSTNRTYACPLVLTALILQNTPDASAPENYCWKFAGQENLPSY